MSDKQYIKMYPAVRFSFEGQIVSAEYFEAYKFYNYFLMTQTGLIAFSSDKKHEVMSKLKVTVSTSQYKFTEVK
jgi:hypothetical protein